MATYDVVAVKLVVPSPIDGGGDRITYKVNPSQVSNLAAGDRVNFSSSGDTFTFTGFNSTMWTNSSNITGSGTKIVKSGIPNGATDAIAVYSGGSYRANFVADFTVPDEHPDPLGLSDIRNVDPKGVVSQTFTVTGINKTVRVTVSGTGSRFVYLQRTGETNSQEDWASNGESFTVVAEAEHDYDETERTITVTVGTRTETFKVVTRKWPLPEQVINLGISAPSELLLKRDIATFFGGSQQPFITDYFRGGGLVPSIEQNQHVPRSLPIYITDLYDTSSALYFIYKPPNKATSANTTTGAKTLSLNWDVINDYTVGYGELAKYLEYKYVLTVDSTELQNTTGSASDVQLNSTNGTPTVWHQNNGQVFLTVSCPQNQERWYKGTLTLQCRNAIDTSLVIQRTVNWSMFFMGP